MVKSFHYSFYNWLKFKSLLLRSENKKNRASHRTRERRWARLTQEKLIDGQIDDITKLSIGVCVSCPVCMCVYGITKLFKGARLEGLINSTEATFLSSARLRALNGKHRSLKTSNLSASSLFTTANEEKNLCLSPSLSLTFFSLTLLPHFSFDKMD